VVRLTFQPAAQVWIYTQSNIKKLFIMLNIGCRSHTWLKSLKTPPHTEGTCLRQQSRVTLSSADSSSVRRAYTSICGELSSQRLIGWCFPAHNQL
jgi:hypothetical protein